MESVHQLLQGAPGVSKENAGNTEHKFRGVRVQKYKTFHPTTFSNKRLFPLTAIQYSLLSLSGTFDA